MRGNPIPTVELDLLCDLIARLDEQLTRAERARADLRRACHGTRISASDSGGHSIDTCLEELLDLRQRLDMLIDALSLRVEEPDDQAMGA